MSNPWLSIPQEEYEKHMQEVGQAQALNKLCRQALEKYQPKEFALIGCSTGNGLEHVNPEITEATFAIDINAEYLQTAKEKFQGKLQNLNCIQADIQFDDSPLKNIDLIFIGLVLEYVDPEQRCIIYLLIDKIYPSFHLVDIRMQTFEERQARNLQPAQAAPEGTIYITPGEAQSVNIPLI